MGVVSKGTKDENLKGKSGTETRKQSGSFNSMIPMKTLFKVSNSRTQLFLLFVAIYYMTMHLELFKHPTNSLITDTRM